MIETGKGKTRRRSYNDIGWKRENRMRNSSKSSSRSTPTTNTRPIPIPLRPPRRFSFRTVLVGVFLVVIFVWHAILFRIINSQNFDNESQNFDNESQNFDNESQNFDNESQNDQIPPILIVGGSDGSGTRAVVETLRDLGTVVVSEDDGTFDVHAGQIAQGWPGLIKRIYSSYGRKGFFATEERQSLNSDSNPVLISSDGNSTSRLKANFDWPPKNIHLFKQNYEKDAKIVEDNIKKLLNTWEFLKKKKGTFFARGSSVKKKMYPDGRADDVAYAVKAPVSMLALPVFVSCFSFRRKQQQQPPQPLKFLHVIRDGRDVALSENQSPVIKFYNLTYPKQVQDDELYRSKFSDSSLQPKNPDRMYARAMQLWNDWNVVVHRWGMTHNINNRAARSNSEDVVPSVDYLWVRSEDLLVPGSQKRLDALTAVAKFVGSSLTPEELCCLSRQETLDHGKSHTHSKGNNVRSRFGAAGVSANARRASIQKRNRADEEYMYDNWKDFVSAALLREHESKASIHHLIRQGEYLLKATRKKGKMNSDTVEAEIIVPLEKIKAKLGHRRLLAEMPHNTHIDRIEADNNNKNRSHHNTKLGASNPVVLERYGKWQKALENKTELSNFFHREGAEGLRVFGYHPYRQINYREQYGDSNRTGHNITESFHKKTSNIYNESIIDDEELEDGGTLPGICQVSVACPKKEVLERNGTSD